MHSVCSFVVGIETMAGEVAKGNRKTNKNDWCT